MSGVSYQTVIADDHELRLDKWLQRHYPALKFGEVQKLIRTGQVRIDGKRGKPQTRLQEGQEIRVPPLATKQGKREERFSEISDNDRAFMQGLVLYEDEELIGLNKPPGIAVQGGSKTRRHIDALLPALARENALQPRLVHRLDKETSGVLVIAKTAQAAKKLGHTFKHGYAEKEYWALVVPPPEQNEGTIAAALAKQKGRGGERVMANAEEGKKAETDFAVIERIGYQAAWMVFMPHTGRTHQIRAHAALIGSPILGDEKYGGEKMLLEGEGEQALHLHARRLRFLPSEKGLDREREIIAPLPEHMLKTWKNFNFEPEKDCREVCNAG